MRSRRRAVWIVSVLGCIGLVLLLVLGKGSDPGARRDRSEPLPQTAWDPRAGDVENGEAVGRDSLPPPGSAAGSEEREARSGEVSEGVRIEKGSKPEHPEDCLLEVRVRDELGQPCEGFLVRRNGHPDAVPIRSGGCVGYQGFSDPVYKLEVRSGSTVLTCYPKLEADCDYTLEVTFPREGVPVTGIVTRRGGEPVPGLSLGLVREGNGTVETWLSFRATTDDSGRYRFECVPPGTFMFGTFAGDGSTESKGTDSQLCHRSELVVPGHGMVVRDLAFDIRSIFGVLLDADTGEPITNTKYAATAWVYSQHYLPPEIASALGNGAFEFVDLASGAYMMGFWAPGYARHLVEDVVVLEGKEHKLEIQLRREAVLDLTVLDSNGQPLEGMAALGLGSFPDFRDTQWSGKADETGTVRLGALPPGVHHVKVFGGHWAWMLDTDIQLVQGENHLTLQLEPAEDE